MDIQRQPLLDALRGALESPDPYAPTPGGQRFDVVEPSYVVVPDARSGQRCVRSLRALAVGEVLAPFGADTIEARPTRMTVQVSEHTHITLAPPSLAFINHGCAPNVHFDVERRQVVAIEPIAPGDEITFFYPSTEWVMASPFDCCCGSARCLGRIAGASAVPVGALSGRPLAPHVERLLGLSDLTAVAP